MKATLKNANTNEVLATYIDGEKVEADKNAPPVKSALAERYENALNAFGDKVEEATKQLRFRGGQSDLRRYGNTAEEQAEKFLDTIENIGNRVASLQSALLNLKQAERLREDGEPALFEYEHAIQKWHADNTNREIYEANPEDFTLHAIAIKKVMREAEQVAKKPWHKLTNYYYYKGIYATVKGLTADEVEQALDEYIKARQMSYTVSTKNLKMRVA